MPNFPLTSHFLGWEFPILECPCSSDVKTYFHRLMNGNSGPPTNLENIERRKPLEDALVRLFCQFGPEEWKLPALELNAERDMGRQVVTLTARAFDLNGDAEVIGAPQPLMDAAASYHQLCASFGEDWKRCLLTLTVNDEGKVTHIQWNFSYPY